MDDGTPADIRALDEQLAKTGDDAAAVVAGLSEESGGWRPAPGAWSVAECLDHLATADRVYLAAMRPAGAARRRSHDCPPTLPAGFSPLTGCVGLSRLRSRDYDSARAPFRDVARRKRLGVVQVNPAVRGLCFPKRFTNQHAADIGVRPGEGTEDPGTTRHLTRTYTNPLDPPFQPIQDTAAFATCP